MRTTTRSFRLGKPVATVRIQSLPVRNLRIDKLISGLTSHHESGAKLTHIILRICGRLIIAYIFTLLDIGSIRKYKMPHFTQGANNARSRELMRVLNLSTAAWVALDVGTLNTVETMC